MSVILDKKGCKVNLSKASATGGALLKVALGLGWDPFQGRDVDCDAYAFPITSCGIDKANIIYFGGHKNRYGKVADSYGAMEYSGDDTTGNFSDGGDDETITLDLTKVPDSWERIVFGMNIYDGKNRNIDFGNLQNCYIRLVDMTTNVEACKYTLDGGPKGKTAIIFIELYRYKGEFKLKTIGEYFDADKPTPFLKEVQKIYG